MFFFVLALCFCVFCWIRWQVPQQFRAGEPLGPWQFRGGLSGEA